MNEVLAQKLADLSLDELTEVDPTAVTEEAMVAAIDRTYTLFLEHGQKTLEYAARLGWLLRIVRAKCQYGEWEPWVETHCRFTPRMARNYVRFVSWMVTNRKRVSDFHGVAFRQVLKLIAGVRPSEEPPTQADPVAITDTEPIDWALLPDSGGGQVGPFRLRAEQLEQWKRHEEALMKAGLAANRTALLVEVYARCARSLCPDS